MTLQTRDFSSQSLIVLHLLTDSRSRRLKKIRALWAYKVYTRFWCHLVKSVTRLRNMRSAACSCLTALSCKITSWLNGKFGIRKKSDHLVRNLWASDICQGHSHCPQLYDRKLDVDISSYHLSFCLVMLHRMKI